MHLTAFISHSVAPADATLLAAFEAECAKIGVGIYLAEREFAPASVVEKIRTAIAAADVVIVFLTAAGAASAWVNQEIAIANEKDKPIVPVLEEGVAPPGIIRERDQIRFSRARLGDAFDRVTQYLEKFKRSREAEEESAGVSAFGKGVAVGVAIAAGIALVVVLLIKLFSRE